MINVTDLQELVKNREKLYIFAEYEYITKGLSTLFLSEAREGRLLRTIQNFIKKDFIQINLVINKKHSKSELEKIKKRFENANIIILDDAINLKDIVNNSEKLVIYIGKDKNIAELNNGYKININTLKSKQKNVDLIFTPQEFADFLIETNNLYL